MKKYKLAIVGATGLVGRTALKILEEKNIPNLEYTLFYSKKECNVAEREVQRLAKILGNSIVERRKILGMTQIELANRLDMAPDALSRIENGYVAPRFNRIEEMAKVLECSVAELFREKNDSLKTRSDCIADIISPLPAEKQEEVISLVSHFVSILRK